jgi:hypothetical protein
MESEPCQNFDLWQFHDFTIPSSDTLHAIARKKENAGEKVHVGWGIGGRNLSIARGCIGCRNRD